MAKPCLHDIQQSGDFRREDSQDQFLRTEDAWRTIALENTQLLPEQQEFKILLLIGPPYGRDEIKQQHTAMGNKTVSHSTSRTSSGQRS